MISSNYLYLIDGIAPFFVDTPGEGVINWSKIPFEALESDGQIDQTKCSKVLAAFKIFSQKAHELGFNAITLDDLAHLIIYENYPDSLKKTITVWYLPEYSLQQIYFRRFRIPPLIWVFWDTIIIHHTLRKILRRVVKERKKAIAEGYASLAKIQQVRIMAQDLGLETKIFDYQYATFEIVAVAREYFLTQKREPLEERLAEMVALYKIHYPHGFKFDIDFRPFWLKKQLVALLLCLLLRKRPKYRWFDRHVLIPLTSWSFPLLLTLHRKRIPKFSRKQTMGIEFLFK